MKPAKLVKRRSCSASLKTARNRKRWKVHRRTKDVFSATQSFPSSFLSEARRGLEQLLRLEDRGEAEVVEGEEQEAVAEANHREIRCQT